MELLFEKARPKDTAYTLRVCGFEVELWRSAAKKEGVPVSELIRAATRAAATEILEVHATDSTEG